MKSIIVLILVASVCVVSGLPVETSDLHIETVPQRQEPEAHSIKRRFINPLFSLGTAETDDIVKMRTKRSDDECEKLRLCKLHARSGQSFFASFELYFVNKENAHLWDHRARSMADCEQRYGDCYDE